MVGPRDPTVKRSETLRGSPGSSLALDRVRAYDTLVGQAERARTSSRLVATPGREGNVAGNGSIRPTGVTILAVLGFLAGAFGVLGGLGALGIGGFLAAVAGPIGIVAMIAGVFILVLALLQLAVAYGYWTLATWAWRFGIVVAALSVLFALLGFLGSGNFANLAWSVVINGLIIWYLNKAEVRTAFAAPSTGFPVVGNSLDRYIPKS